MKFNLKLISLYIIILITIISGGFLIAGTISTTSTPTPTSYTLTDIYNLIHNATTTEANHNLYPSTNTGTPTMYSISELYVDLANLINPASTTATYLGITPNVTPDEVTAISKDFTPTTNSGTVTGFTLDDIYTLITENTRPLTPSHTYTPASSPAETQHTLSDIYTSLSTLIDPANIATGTSYLGVVGSYVPIPPDPCGTSGDVTDPDCWSTQEGEYNYAWSNEFVATGIQSTTDGAANTTALVALGTGKYPAAEYCYNLVEGGYDDWYLPAINQLAAGLEEYKTQYNLGNTTWGGFADLVQYWSSTEVSYSSDILAWVAYSAVSSNYVEVIDDRKEYTFVQTRCLR